MGGQGSASQDLLCDEARAGGARLAAQLDAERFYGVVPEHVWEALRHGDELSRDIAAAAGLVRWRRQAARRALAALKRMRLAPPQPADLDARQAERLMSAFAEARRLYRQAQAEHRAFLDERWRRRLADLRAAAE